MPHPTHLDARTITIRRDTRQRQSNITDLSDLIPSIKNIGIIQPIIVREVNDETILVAGERRLLASIEAERFSVPVRFMEDLSEEEAEIIELEENVRRKDLHWRDHVKAIGRLHLMYINKDKTWSVDKTAGAVSLGLSQIYKILKVHEHLSSTRIAHAESIENAYNSLAKFSERKAEAIVTDIIANAGVMFTTTATQQPPPPSATTSVPPPMAPTLSSDFNLTSIVKTFDENLSVPPTSVIVDPPKVIVPSGPVICANFLEWAKTYSGSKFSLIHCDFPYGNYKGDDSQGSQSGTEVEDFYDNHEEIYWTLLTGLTENLPRLLSYSAHVIFWFNMNFYTETVKRLRTAGLFVHDHPLIWHKTPGGGGAGVVPGTATTYPRRMYDTALLCVMGNRPLAKAGSNSYSAPTVGAKIHPSQKPESMLRHFLSMVVDETTTVLDPTCGSAAALRAAEDLGARYILGIEMEQGYATTAQAKTLEARVKRQAGILFREKETV